ncbi:pyridoxamine 5'-phosphate oxidase family protein [Fodinicurvata sediminis]|uniref:pyridoxamine 5'-phosphate oxidase family protein n=1 Tax=Fodinicurvata sediminis TaxID=1121832 RepID=UPI0003B65921|nr:pyridoxamine 5'-phosphate oxidase family protein [Fodinicurvata sediminis]
MAITTVAQLEALYDTSVSQAAREKETDRVIAPYAHLIEASPFAILATSGPEGLDCSPRGDRPGFLKLQDDRTLILPDRKGNNRLDSLRNILNDPRVALLFLIPGSGTTLRVNGRAIISDDPELLDSLAIDGKPPKTALVISVETVYFQCARAVLRAGLWDSDSQVDPKSLPSAGDILEAVSQARINGESFDQDWNERAVKTLW